MIVPVKLPVKGVVLEPKIGAQIDDLAAELEQGDGVLRGDTMGKREENDFGLFREQVGVGFAEAQDLRAGIKRKARKDLRDGLTGVLARSDGGEFGQRMGQQQPQE